MSKKLIQAAAGAGGESVYVEDVFSTYLYEGNDGNQTITNGIDLSGEGGMVWIKARDSAKDNVLSDTERGATKYLESNTTDAETTATAGLKAFNSDGFDLGTNNKFNDLFDYVSWSFRKQAGFFDVVTYTGTGSSKTISHNLGSTPGFIITKKTSGTGNWICLDVGTGKYGYLDLANALSTATIEEYWGNDSAYVAPTSSSFTIGSNANMNVSGETYVAYLFAHDDQSFGDNSDESIIKCGSYTGTGSSQEINLGFEPQWILIKNASSVGGWILLDTMRGWANSSSSDNYLFAHSSSAEAATDFLDITATGFIANSASFYGSGETYIYIAIRRPMKTPEAGTDVFAAETIGATNGGSLPSYVSGFPVDMLIQARRDADNHMLLTRLLGETRLFTNLTNAESAESDADFDYQDGAFSNTSVDTNRLGYMFKRATGFFDVVAYTGTGSNRTIAHNLGVAPEMMIIKARESLSPYVAGWVVYHSGISPADSIYLSQDGGSSGASFQFASTAPTSSVFTLGSAIDVNMSGKDFISYHFATLAGVSKVGSYTGTGSDINVDCGFNAGARFVLIKRTDSSGDWYVYDSTRGIVAGNDPYILLNSTAAETTGTDYIDPLNAGFTVTSSAPAALNTSGGTYIFLAIA